MRKGFGARNITLANISALKGGTEPTRIHTSWGSWLVDENLDFSGINVKWYPILGYGVNYPNFAFNAANIEAVAEHPNYDGWWAIGNENYGGDTPQAFWTNEAKPQIDAVKAVDSLAKFVVAIGCAGCGGGNDFIHWAAGSWGRELFEEVIPASYLTQNGGRIKAYHWHLYPGPLSIIDCLNADVAFRTEALYSPLQSWITEMGRPTDSGQDKYNPAYMLQKCKEKGISEADWYAQTYSGGSGNNYYMLQETPPTNTDYGNQFKNF